MAKKIQLIVVVSAAVLAGCGYEPVENNTESGQSDTALITLPTPSLCVTQCTCDEVILRANDSGVEFSGQYPEGNASDCRETPLQAQDCAVGRDSLALLGQLQKVGNGAAGFDYSKTGPSGEQLPDDAIEWDCIVDNHTGLMWEVKQAKGSGGLRDSSYSYSWFSSELSEYASDNQGSCFDDTNCDTEKFAARVNETGLCSFTDWRLPTKIELHDLVHYGTSAPSFDTRYFRHGKAGAYWASTIDTDDPGSVWRVDFFYGSVGGVLVSTLNMVRLVREIGSAGLPQVSVTASESDLAQRQQVAPLQRCNELAPLSAPLARFKRDPGGTIFDRYTGLVWQRCLQGQSGELCQQGSPALLTWDEALSVAVAANEAAVGGFTNWRVPNIKELQLTAETQCEEPPLNPFVFPNVPLTQVWSSTPSSHFPQLAQHYQYQNGILARGQRVEKHAVHLVRDCKP